jgi:hypothetical protein
LDRFKVSCKVKLWIKTISYQTITLAGSSATSAVAYKLSSPDSVPWKLQR